MELARRGFEVTGVDITPAYIQYAAEQAQKEHLKAIFLCSDIREIAFKNEFDVVLNMADGAIGYLENDTENNKIFAIIARALKPGGRHFMDIMNADYGGKQNETTLSVSYCPPPFDFLDALCSHRCREGVFRRV